VGWGGAGRLLLLPAWRRADEVDAQAGQRRGGPLDLTLAMKAQWWSMRRMQRLQTLQ
jgi:hypothetical protein